MRSIKDEKVLLRAATLNDRKQIFEWLTHSDITSKMIGPPDFSDTPIPAWEFFVNDYNRHFFDDTDPGQGRSFVIEVNEEAVGHINYNEINRKTNSVELDIWLAGSRYCNKGYGSDAINTLCKFLSDDLSCSCFILAPSARNINAIKAYEKCGFRATTEILNNFIPDYDDTVLMIRKIEKDKAGNQP